MTEQHLFKWRHFQADIILLCVRWYLRYALSYRDLEEMMLERGLSVDHTTIFRWVQRYSRNWRSGVGLISKPAMTPGESMRRTSKSRRSGCICIERSIRMETRSTFFLSTTRDGEAAKQFFLKILAAPHTKQYVLWRRLHSSSWTVGAVGKSGSAITSTDGPFRPRFGR